MNNPKTQRTFKKVTQRMKAILLRNTQQKTKRLCAVFCNFKFIIKQFERSAHLRNVFQHSKRNFVSLRGHVISSIYSSSKLKTKLEVISRYHEVVRSHFVKQPKQAETSRTCTPNLFPQLGNNFIAIFQVPNYLGSQQRNRLIQKLRLSSHLTGHTGESV